MEIRIRRFDPAGGVSRHMVEAEAKYVSREAQAYLRLSINDLKEKLSERGRQWHQADEALHAMVLALPERDRLAVQCMLVRDQMFLLELYLEYLRTTQPEGAAPMQPPIEEAAEQVPQAPMGSAAFSEWLFGT